MITILTLLSLFTISSYIWVMVSREGIPSSVSATYYSLNHKFWFGFTMVATAGLLMPAILEITPDKYQFTAFLACAGMIIVGSAPNFREDWERKIHTIGAVLTIGFSQIWVGCVCPWTLSIWSIYIILAMIFTEKNWNGNFIESFEKTNPLFWIECVALSTTYLTVFIL